MKTAIALPSPLRPGPEWVYKRRMWRPPSRAEAGPLISVLVPSYEQGAFLEATLRSILGQDYPNVECLVMDGGSKDGSVDVIRHYQDFLAVWRSEPDRGQAHALNKGLDACAGEWVGFLNSDDLYTPHALRTLARLAGRYPEADFIHGERILLDASGGGVLGWTADRDFDPARAGYTLRSEACFWRRREPWRRMRFDETLHFAMDLDFFGRMRTQGAQFLHTAAYLGCFRCQPAAKSARMKAVCDEETFRLWSRHFKGDRPPTPIGGVVDFWRMAWAGLRHPRMLAGPFWWRKVSGSPCS